MRNKLIECLIVIIIGWDCSLPDVGTTSPIRYWDLSTGSQIAYVEFLSKDSAAAISLIYLHGGPGGYAVSKAIERIHSNHYRKLADLGFNIYIYDQIGGGLSARLDDPTDYTVARHIEDLEKIRVFVGNKPIVLIAGSWGVTLASHYMAKYPANVMKAIFISPKNIDYCDLSNKGDTSISPADLLSSDLQIIRKRFGEKKYQRYTELVTLMKQSIQGAHAFAGDDEMDELNDSLWTPMIEHYILKDKAVKNIKSHGMGWWSFVMTSYNAYIQKPIKETLRSNRTPILVIRGDNDFIPEETAREYAEVFPNVKVVNVQNSGHLIGLEQPEVLHNEIEKFLMAPLDSIVQDKNNIKDGR